jgi:hypothetical protein
MVRETRTKVVDDESVHDAIHLYYFKTYQKQIISLASWEQLPCLMPL